MSRRVASSTGRIVSSDCHPERSEGPAGLRMTREGSLSPVGPAALGSRPRRPPSLLAEHAALLLHPLAPLLLLLHQALPLLGLQDLLHVEDHQGARLLQLRAGVLD